MDDRRTETGEGAGREHRKKLWEVILSKISKEVYDGPERRLICNERRHDIPWHLDRRVSIAMIFTLLFNSGALVWYASKFDSRLFAVEAKVDETSEWRKQADEQRTRTEIAISAVSQHVADNTKVLDHILQILENNRRDATHR